MDVNPDFGECNVENQIDDSDSVLGYWKDALSIAEKGFKGRRYIW